MKKAMMDSYTAQRLIGEDAIQLMFERYQILENIKLNQPVGRRKLLSILNMPERKLRTHLEYLQGKELIIIDKRGVLLNETVEDITPFLLDYFGSLNNGYRTQAKLEAILKIPRVIVASGDSSEDPTALRAIGTRAASFFAEKLTPNGGIIAVSGGATLKNFTESLPPIPRSHYTVLPVRGAIGSSHSAQANTIALYTGLKLKCNALQLNIPDNIDDTLLATLSVHPDIVAVTSLYKKIDILLFGIGRADVMAEYRTLTNEEKSNIINSNCVAEACGYYVSSDGSIVKKASGIGISLEDLERIPIKIALAGGKQKKHAIKAVCTLFKDITLVTDESFANALIE
jgi:central glycolytic genes regulator